MPEYIVKVYFTGSGRLKVRAGSRIEAEEDARQMDPDDIDWDSYTIVISHDRESYPCSPPRN